MKIALSVAVVMLALAATLIAVGERIHTQIVTFSVLCEGVTLPTGGELTVREPTMLHAFGFKLAADGEHLPKVGEKSYPDGLRFSPTAHVGDIFVGMIPQSGQEISPGSATISLAPFSILEVLKDPGPGIQASLGVGEFSIQTSNPARIQQEKGEGICLQLSGLAPTGEDSGWATSKRTISAGRAHDEFLDWQFTPLGPSANLKIWSSKMNKFKVAAVPPKSGTVQREMVFESLSDSRIQCGNSFLDTKGWTTAKMQLAGQVSRFTVEIVEDAKSGGLFKVTGEAPLTSLKSQDRGEKLPSWLERTLQSNVNKGLVSAILVCVLFIAAVIFKRALDIIIKKLMPDAPTNDK